MVTSKTVGDSAEEAALRHLLQHGLALVQRNYRVAAGPRARGGEIDLIMRERDGTLVFVEVRARSGAQHGGAAASVGCRKRARVIFAAQRFLQFQPTPPPCRFDVIVFEGGALSWLRAAFDADGAG